MEGESQAAADVVQPGRWVEIRSTVLEAAERAPQVPEDTRQVPLEMRARGFLRAEAAIGDEVEIANLAIDSLKLNEHSLFGRRFLLRRVRPGPGRRRWPTRRPGLRCPCL